MNIVVGVVMGSKSDWDTMQHAVDTLAILQIEHETRVVSAHRTPDLLFDYASSAADRGLEIIIAGAGGAAHLPGMLAAKTHLPGRCAERNRFTVIHCTNACRDPRWHAGNRSCRRGERGVTGCQYAGKQIPGNSQESG